MVTLVGVVGIAIFEAYVRWNINQNYAVLDPGAFAGVAVLLGIELLALVWLSRSS